MTVRRDQDGDSSKHLAYNATLLHILHRFHIYIAAQRETFLCQKVNIVSKYIGK